MSRTLYTHELVALAKDTEYCSNTFPATHRGRATSTLCGDDIEIRMRIQDGRCQEIGFDAQACIVCRASAVIMCRAILHTSPDPAHAARTSLERAMSTTTSSAPIGEYAMFGVLARFPSRQGCALLPWTALERALFGMTSSCAVNSQNSSRVAATHPVPTTAFAAIEQWREQGQATALATLISVDGSSPCPLGSQMAISEQGAFWGSVSGGCVETAIVAAGVTLLNSETPDDPVLLRYRIANSQAGEVGLPCGGEIQVHLVQAPPSSHIHECRLAPTRSTTSLRVFPLHKGPAQVIDAHQPPQQLPPSLRATLQGKMSSPVLWEGEGTAYFIEPLPGRPRIVLVGGTHIAQKLSELAQILDFEVVLLEPRPTLASADRFPGVRILNEHVETELGRLIHADTAVVMLTHNPRLDDPGVKIALASSAYYIGALGSRKTQLARLSRLSAQGVPEASLDRIHGPVGLSIGAQGASEIALSILGQIIARRRGHKDRPARIGAIVLAAGRSSRFGAEDKRVALVDGEPMLRRTVRNVLSAGVEPCVVVVDSAARRVRESLASLPVEFVEHPDPRQGMGSSVALGIRSLARHELDAAFVVLGDMPFVRVEDYEALAAAHRASTQHLIVAPEAGREDQRRLGNPILWPARYFDALAQLKGDRGAKSLLLDAPGAVLRLFVDHPGVLRDVDSPGDLVDDITV